MSFRTARWISKTDLTRYLRCPYAFYLLDRGLIPFEAAVNEQQARLIRDGIEFQAAIEAPVPSRAIDPAELPQVLANEAIRLFDPPVFENPTLEIYGKPDAIDTDNGALIPVEIKSHKDVQRCDELELAFYWVLLEPHRTREVSPRGRLLLRRNGTEEEVEVAIGQHRFNQVCELLDAIRNARDHGVLPRICGCTVCSGIMREEICRSTSDRKDLSMIYGIGRHHAQRLEEIGINDYDQLVVADSATLVKRLHERRCYVSPAQVDGWKHHARSYATARPVLFGAVPPLNIPFLVLDLEYQPGSIIWLVGGCIVTQGDRLHFALWADTVLDEVSNLITLASLVETYPSAPVVTWAGSAADIPQLTKATQRLNLGHISQTVRPRHFDLFRHAEKTVRFPVPRLALIDVAKYFAIPKVSRIQNGIEAQMLYREYCACPDSERRLELKSRLLEYNRDDVDALVGVAERLVGLKD